MALETSAELAFEYLAMVEECAAGLAWVRMDDVLTWRRQFMLEEIGLR